MEWLQVGVVVSLFVVWLAAVLLILAVLSVGRRGDEEGGSAHLSGLNPGDGSSAQFSVRILRRPD